MSQGLGIRILKFSVLVLVLTVGGIALGAFAIAYFEYGRDHWTPPVERISLTFFTGITFAAVIAEFRASWNRLSFWLWLLLLLGVHLSLYILLLTRVHEWRIPWFLAVSLQPPVLGEILDRMGFETRWHTRRKVRTRAGR